jgi:hypothetical protein
MGRTRQYKSCAWLVLDGSGLAVRTPSSSEDEAAIVVSVMDGLNRQRDCVQWTGMGNGMRD